MLKQTIKVPLGDSPLPIDALEPWAHLLRLKPAQNLITARQGVKYQSSAIDGIGWINLDYHAVRIDELPKGETPASWFKNFRLNINTFVDQDNTQFDYFQEDTDKPIWVGTNPLGAAMIIKVNRLLFTIPGVRYVPSLDDGIVIVTVSEPTRWVFTTARLTGAFAITINGGIWSHPVSGHREFGIQQIEGALTFYTRGADRATGTLDVEIGEALGSIETWLGVKGNPNMVTGLLHFRGAFALWSSLQQRMRDEIVRRGGRAEVLKPHSARYDWDAVKAKYIS